MYTTYTYGTKDRGPVYPNQRRKFSRTATPRPNTRSLFHPRPLTQPYLTSSHPSHSIIHPRTRPPNIMLHHNILPLRIRSTILILRTLNTILLAPPRPRLPRRNLIRQLNLIIGPQLPRHEAPISRPKGAIMTTTKLTPGSLAADTEVGDCGKFVIDTVQIVAGVRPLAGLGRDGGPPATEEGREGRQAGTHDADEGLAAGPDEDAGHGPCQVRGLDELVDGHDADYGGDADARCRGSAIIQGR